MARCDVYRLPEGNLVVDVQADDFAQFETRAVVPLEPYGRVRQLFPRLNPSFAILGEEFTMFPEAIATVPLRVLSGPITNLSDRQHDITGAVDMLLTGV